MSVRRIVPDIKSKHLEASRQFYVDVLGLEVAMDMGSIVTLVSPSNPTAQVTVMRDDDSSAILPQVSIEVSDVDGAHSRPRLASVLGTKNATAFAAKIVERTEASFVTLHNCHHDFCITGAN